LVGLERKEEAEMWNGKVVPYVKNELQKITREAWQYNI